MAEHEAVTGKPLSRIDGPTNLGSGVISSIYVPVYVQPLIAQYHDSDAWDLSLRLCVLLRVID